MQPLQKTCPQSVETTSSDRCQHIPHLSVAACSGGGLTSHGQKHSDAETLLVLSDAAHPGHSLGCGSTLSQIAWSAGRWQATKGLSVAGVGAQGAGRQTS